MLLTYKYSEKNLIYFLHLLLFWHSINGYLYMLIYNKVIFRVFCINFGDPLFWMQLKKSRYFYEIWSAFWPCIDSNATKRSKDIVKIVHVTSVVQP